MESTSSRLMRLREEVLHYALKMSRLGLVPATWGNVSAVDAETQIVAITPSGMPYESLGPEDICLVDLNGRVVEAKWKPSTETALHLVFYKNRPATGAVIHTHSVYATAFACAGQEIPVVVSTLASGVGGRVPVAPYQPAGTEELGLCALRAMGDKTAVLLANHGVVAVGENLADACTVAELVENAAKIAILSQILGKVNEIPRDEVKRIREKYLTAYGQKK